MASLTLLLFALCESVETATRLPVVEIGDAAPFGEGRAGFAVEVADDDEERSRGLSGRDPLPDDGGMLFVFQEPTLPGFWMRQMRFPLDFVWIGDGCEVVDVTASVPAPEPGTPDSELTVYLPGAPVLYNLEVNAGTAERHGIGVGDTVRFRNVPGGGC